MRDQDLKGFSEEVKKGFVEALGDKSSFKNQFTTYDSLDAPDTFGTSKKGYLDYGITYDDLVDTFGEPTYLPEDSGDGKVNYEWVIDFDFEGSVEMFTIYDWKVDAEWSKENTGTKEQAREWLGGSRWHVGGKDYAGDFIDKVSELVYEVRKNVVQKLPF